VTATDSLVTHWYFHIPNFLLAAAIYTLIGRYLLSVFFGLDSDRVLMRVFRNVTDPILKVVAMVTPKIVPGGLVIVFAVAWLMALRMALFLAFALTGLAPRIGG
jgi:YggT family protein